MQLRGLRPLPFALVQPHASPIGGSVISGTWMYGEFGGDQYRIQKIERGEAELIDAEENLAELRQKHTD